MDLAIQIKELLSAAYLNNLSFSPQKSERISKCDAKK